MQTSIAILAMLSPVIHAAPSVPEGLEKRIHAAYRLMDDKKSHEAAVREFNALCELLMSRYGFNGSEAEIVDMRGQLMLAYGRAGNYSDVTKTAVAIFESQSDQHWRSESFRKAVTATEGWRHGDGRRAWDIETVLGMPRDVDSSAAKYDPQLDLMTTAALDKFGPKAASFFASIALKRKIAVSTVAYRILPAESRLAAVEALRPFANLFELKNPRLLLEASIAFKDLLLDLSLLDERETSNAGNVPGVKKWLAMREDFRKRYSSGKSTTEQELKDLVDAWPWNLREGMNLSVSEVQAMLPEKTAWLDYIFVPNSGTGDVGTYYVVVCTRTEIAGPVFVGSSKDVDSAVESLTAAVTAWLDSASDQGRAKASIDLAQRAAHQHELLLKPALALLPATTESLILSSDGATHLVPFAMLPDATGKFLVQRYNVQHTDSLRGLGNSAASAKLEPKSPRLFVGDPTFSTGRDNLQERTAAETRRLTTSVQRRNAREQTGGQFSPLPGTAGEIAAILSAVASDASFAVVRLEKNAATEAEVCRAMSRANLVHLATHGFTLKPGGTVFPAEKDPMNLAGLALAGANSTFAAWQASGVAKNPNDGILLAGEVAVLDLKRVAQVILSACDTAAGRVVANNGVVGLRRAFGIAGVPQMVVTLWPVLDDVPEPLMKEYYRQVFAGKIGVSSWSACLRSEIDRMKKAQQDAGTMIASLGTFVLVSNQLSSSSAPPDPREVIRLVFHGARALETDNFLSNASIAKHFTAAFLARVKAMTGGSAGTVEKMLPDKLEFLSFKVEGDEASVEMRGAYDKITYILILRDGQWLIDDVL